MSSDRVQTVREFVHERWLKEQHTYHVKNVAIVETMEEGLSLIGYWSFWGTMFVVLLNLALQFLHVSFGLWHVKTHEQSNSDLHASRHCPVPFPECTHPELPVMPCTNQMSTQIEKIMDSGMGIQKFLSLSN
jgi:hypothetical protein